MAIWIFFFSAAPTAQNSPELKIHSRNVAQDNAYPRTSTTTLYTSFKYWNFYLLPPKGGFFSESAIRFSNLPISKKKYSKKLS